MEVGTALLEAAQAAPEEKKRAKFVALVTELKCQDETVEDLLVEGKLLFSLQPSAPMQPSHWARSSTFASA